jgi:retron-type reverse transcriptase
MEVDCIYTDLKKAFDRVDISKLCLKLSIVGIGDPLLSWINSYLTNRKQKVGITSHRSREIKVTSGVPQGSHLGPVLFSIFINDIKNVIRDSLFLLYADDLKLFYNIRSEQDCVRIQDDLCRVVSWCESNGLELNISKCKVIRYSRKKIITLPSYHIHNSALESLFQISDLEIILDSKLTFCPHIKKNCQELKQNVRLHGSSV